MNGDSDWWIFHQTRAPSPWPQVLENVVGQGEEMGSRHHQVIHVLKSAENLHQKRGGKPTSGGCWQSPSAEWHTRSAVFGVLED